MCYNAEGSAKTAIEFLDGGYIRPSHKVTVTQADFTSNSSDAAKSSNDSRSAGKPKLSQAQMKVAKSAMKQALAWNEDDDIGVSKSSALKIVVIEGMFEPKDFDSDPNFEKDLEQDIVSACEECGAVEKLTVFSQNPRGIAIVKFATSYAAQECTKLLNGRFYAKRKLRCYFWDGVTNYSITAQSVQDVDQEEQVEKERLDEFGDWLEDQQEELPDEFKLQVE